MHDFDDSDGFGIALSKTIAGNLFVYADYTQFLDPDEFYAGAGLGYHLPLTSCIDWVGKVGALYSDDLVGQTWGAEVATGLRIGITKWLQLDLFYSGRFVEFDTWESAGSAALIFREVLAPKLDFFVLGSVGEDYESLYTGIRYNF
jgi:hypothetical protein